MYYIDSLAWLKRNRFDNLRLTIPEIDDALSVLDEIVDELDAQFIGKTFPVWLQVMSISRDVGIDDVLTEASAYVNFLASVLPEIDDIRGYVCEGDTHTQLVLDIIAYYKEEIEGARDVMLTEMEVGDDFVPSPPPSISDETIQFTLNIVAILSRRNGYRAKFKLLDPSDAVLSDLKEIAEYAKTSPNSTKDVILMCLELHDNGTELERYSPDTVARAILFLSELAGEL